MKTRATTSIIPSSANGPTMRGVAFVLLLLAGASVVLPAAEACGRGICFWPIGFELLEDRDTTPLSTDIVHMHSRLVAETNTELRTLYLALGQSELPVPIPDGRVAFVFVEPREPDGCYATLTDVWGHASGSPQDWSIDVRVSTSTCGDPGEGRLRTYSVEAYRGLVKFDTSLVDTVACGKSYLLGRTVPCPAT